MIAGTTITNQRTAGHLTNVANFGSLTYHPSGMVENVIHTTPSNETDRYAAQYGIPRPTRITFSPCGAAAPYFLPGTPLAKTNAVACGLQLTWPVATACGGGSSIKYRVLRNDVDITLQESGSKCLSYDSPKLLDKGAVTGVPYTYKIIAEGPPAGTKAPCQGGLETVLEFTGTKTTCDLDTILEFVEPNPKQAHVAAPTTYKALLKSKSGPLQDELGFVQAGREVSALAVTPGWVDRLPRASAADRIVLQGKAPGTKQQAGAALARRDAWLARHADEAVLVWDGADDFVGKLVRSFQDHLGDEEVWVIPPA